MLFAVCVSIQSKTTVTFFFNFAPPPPNKICSAAPAWYTSRNAMTFLFIYCTCNLLSQAHVVQHGIYQFLRTYIFENRAIYYYLKGFCCYSELLSILENEKCTPYRKPNNEPFYVDSRSCHPPSILKPRLIELDWLGQRYHVTKHVIQPDFERSRGAVPACSSLPGFETIQNNRATY